MKKTSFIFLSALLVNSFSFSYETKPDNLKKQSILYLFKKYEEKADLSNKTKKESLGHVIVFTRKDLDIMQANYLADVLKLVPNSNFGPNKYGVESITGLGRRYQISTRYRLYINDHEISSISTYSPFLTYDRYPLDNIDHIEIYFSPGAISASNEPSLMIIKMYTKRPERENATILKGILDNKSGHQLGIFSGRKLDENRSYLFTLSHAKIDFDKLTVNNRDISRDQKRIHLFFQYNVNNWYIDTSLSYVDRRNFFGFSLDGSPEKEGMYSAVGFISATGQFLQDKSLKINLAYDIQRRQIIEKNKQADGGILHPAFKQATLPTYIDEVRTLHKLAFTINKEWNTSNNELLIGAFVRYYQQDLDKFSVEYLDGAIKRDEKNNPNFNVVDYFWISSIYIENKHNLNDRNLFIIGARLDDYKFEGNKTQKDINTRVGYISYPRDNWLIKGFITKGYLLPSMFTVETSLNKKLDPVNFISYTTESTYKINNHSISGFLCIEEITNDFTYNPVTRSIENSNQKYTIFIGSLRYIWDVNPFNKFEFYVWKSKIDKSSVKTLSPTLGGYTRLLTEYKTWKVYNELVFRDKYTNELYNRKVDATFDYTFGISKEFKNGWILKFKGENIFNNSAKVLYKPIIGSVYEYQAFDRRFLITLEKVF